MKVQLKNSDKVVVEITKDELVTIGNCLNEVCNGLDVDNFELSIGVNIEKAQYYLDFLNEVYRRAEKEFPEDK